MNTELLTKIKTPVPFLDLAAQDGGLRDEVLLAFENITDSSHYVLGPYVESFERAFAEAVGTRHCIGVNSGTSALHLALIAAGVSDGDEVITVPMTFVATAWAIRYVNARPVFVDIDPETYTMDVDQIESRITPRTKAILPVHLYGQSADMTAIMEIADRHGLTVVEDAAQAHGAMFDGKPVGSFGQSACFSFYPGKNLGAYGEAGAVVTNNDAVAGRIRALRNHAQNQRYHHQELGFNYRMDAFQGAVLGIKLRRLGVWTKQRQRLADSYQMFLEDLPIVLPQQGDRRSHVWHVYVALHPERDQIREALQRQGIQTGLHYPVPLHLLEAFRELGYREGDFPVAERVGNECFSLPMFPNLSRGHLNDIAEALTAWFE